jgi:hypothetical protein
MKQVAVLGAMIVKHIEENELDEAVGVGREKPQIWFVPDWPSDMNGDKYNTLPRTEQLLWDTREISKTEYDEIEKQVNEQYPKIGLSLAEITL